MTDELVPGDDHATLVQAAGRLLLGLGGPEVRLTGRTCGWLVANGGLDELRTAVRGADPEVDAALLAIALAGKKWLGVPRDPAVRKSPETARESEEQWLTADLAGQRLGISGRRVRQLISTRALPGTLRGAKWMVRRADLDDYDEKGV